jgi:nitrate/nitrite transporter NarK
VAASTTTAPSRNGVPARAGLALSALALAALVRNINLAVANVALPDIGRDFGASQIELNLIAVGCTLGLAMSVLCFGAIGDRYGRKQMLVIGLVGTVVASILSAFAPTADFLAFSRLLTGLAAGMAYPKRRPASDDAGTAEGIRLREDLLAESDLPRLDLLPNRGGEPEALPD